MKIVIITLAITIICRKTDNKLCLTFSYAYVRARLSSALALAGLSLCECVQCTQERQSKSVTKNPRLYFNCIRLHLYIAWHIVTLKCDGTACSGLRFIQQFIANLKLICNRTTDDAMNLMRFFPVLSLSFPLSLSCSHFCWCFFLFSFAEQRNDNHTYLCRM